jgi:hypothetical protein
VKVLYTGSRDWVDERPVRLTLRYLYLRASVARPGHMPEPLVIVHGAARGLDEMVEQLVSEAKQKRPPILPSTKPYPADWSQGRGAGPKRNQLMLDENPDLDLCVAFFLRPDSRGTGDMVRRARHAGVPVWAHLWGDRPLPRPPKARLIPVEDSQPTVAEVFT